MINRCYECTSTKCICKMCAKNDRCRWVVKDKCKVTVECGMHESSLPEEVIKVLRGTDYGSG